MVSNSVPRARFSFGQYHKHGLWLDPKQEVHELRTSGSSTQTKFEVIMVSAVTKDATAHKLILARDSRSPCSWS